MRSAAALALLLAALPGAGWAAAEGFPLDDANIDVSNLASLQRGARNFVNYCLGCHSAKYMRYSQLAEDLALTEDELRANLMFTGERIYDTMETAMPAEKAREWFGNAPPDLSLITRSRGTDYVYTFLRSFYADASRPTGVDNAVLPGTAMPHVLAHLQGLQRPRFGQREGEDGGSAEHLVGLEPGTAGEMPAAAFDSFVRDLVAFLEYVAEPHKAKRLALGVWVVLFLLMFAAFSWFLYKEYWKDVK
ncbi:MAG TPA: cytochrome c1 [Steroidobacteraceae bacterium]|nr:cytochrome c1 [Steroidobacteraceae bacterium]